MKLLHFICLLTGCFIGITQERDSLYYPNYQLKEVTVIANRISDSELVPYSITELDSSLINQPFQNLSIKERLLQIPGVYIQNANNFAQDARISIRGFGANAAFGIRGIKLIVDGIPETTPDGTGQLDNLNLDQIGKIQVIRGSASSLYGNASGGALILNSRQIAQNFMAFQSMLGSYDFTSHSISGGVKTKQTSFQGSLRLFESEGYRNHSSFQQLNARFAVTHRFSDRLSAVFISEFVDSPMAQDAGGLTLEETETDFRMARDRNLTFDAGESVRQWKLGASLTWKWSQNATLNSYAFVNRRTFDGRLPFESAGIIALNRSYVGIGNSLDIKSGIHTIKAGYDLFYQIDDRVRSDNQEGTAGPTVFDQEESFFNVGIFVMDQIEWGRWFFSSGLRFDLNALRNSDQFLSDGDDSGEIDMNNWSYQLGVGRAITPLLQGFLNHSTSFETPTLNQLGNRPDNSGGFEDLKAATAQNIEGGLRWRSSKVNLELVGFITRTESELVPYELEEFPERTFYRNTGETLRSGIEFSSGYQDQKFSLFTSYTYSKFTFEEYIENDVDLDGFSLPGIPQHQLNLNFMYRPHPRASLSLPLQYVGELWADNQNLTSIDSYFELSILGSYQFDLKKLEIEPNFGIRNLLNQQYFDNIRINAFGNRYYEPAPERNFYIGINLRLTK